MTAHELTRCELRGVQIGLWRAVHGLNSELEATELNFPPGAVCFTGISDQNTRHPAGHDPIP